MNSKLPRLTPLLIVLAAVALVALRDRSGAADRPEGSAARAVVTGVSQGAVAPVIPPPGTGRSSPTIGDELLMRAAAQLERRASVSARLRHQLSFGGNQLYGVGRYWQQGKGDELRVRLELQIAGQDANMLQVSNSRFLWIERQLPTGRTVTRIDLRQLRADPVFGKSPLDDFPSGKLSLSATHSGVVLHSGGLPSLLASLGENFSFLPPQAMRLAAPPVADSQPASVPVFAIVGQWRPDKLAALVVGIEHAGTHTERSPQHSLPDRLPQEVLILVGQADLFPYRIEYRRLETPVAANQDGPRIPYQLSPNPMVVLELADVTFDVPVDTGQFDYAPGDAEWVDQTASVLERLQRQSQVASRTGTDETSLPAR
jgi:hypothetical protein